MNKHYTYIFAKSKEDILVVGFGNDIIKAIGIQSKFATNQLVYLEICEDKETSELRFEQIYKLPKVEKMALIEAQNPDWITLLPGVNIDM